MRRFVTLLGLLAIATASRADWPAGGKAMIKVDDSFNGSREVLFFDLPSGELIALAIGQGGNANGYTARRFAPTGDFSPGWDVAGHSFPQVGIVDDISVGFVPDDSSCFWRVGPGQGGYRGHLFTPDGSLRPGPVGWSMERTFTTSPWSAVAAGLSGDIYSTYANRLLRVNRSGALVAGWPATGVVVPGGYALDMLGDGAGGVIVFAPGSAVGSAVGPAAQRIDASGVRHAGWPAAGLPLSTVPGDGALYPHMWQGLIPSGTSSFIAGWCSVPTIYTEAEIKLQRFGLDGTRDSAWPTGGLVIAPLGPNRGMNMIDDGAGGAYVTWLASDRPRATHVLSDGSLLAADVALLPASARFLEPRYFGGNKLPYVMADRRSDGGLTFAWNDTTISGLAVIRYRRFTPELTPDPLEPAEGHVLATAAQGVNRFVGTVRGVHSDGAGGAFIAWEVMDRTNLDGFQWFAEIWMTRVTPVGTVGVPPRPAATTLALSAARPNPARGSVTLDVTLSNDSPARLELLDVAGRVVRAQRVQGAGTHAITFETLGMLEPGLYFARAASGGNARSTRLVLTR